MASLVPLRVVTSTKEVIGPQAVNHLNQFTSVTFNFNLLPNAAVGDATKYIEDAVAQIQPHYPTVQGTFQGEALVFRQLFQSLPLLLLAAIFVMITSGSSRSAARSAVANDSVCVKTSRWLT